MEPLATAMQWKQTATISADVFARRYREAVYRIALSILGRPDAAEDVTQDVLIRAVRHQDEIGAPLPWLRIATVRRSMTVLADRRLEPLSESVWPAADAAERIAVQQTLAQLDPEQQTLLALIVGERWSYREVAEALNVPEGTVASRLHAAKEEFRQKWGIER